MCLPWNIVVGVERTAQRIVTPTPGERITAIAGDFLFIKRRNNSDKNLPVAMGGGALAGRSATGISSESARASRHVVPPK